MNVSESKTVKNDESARKDHTCSEHATTSKDGSVNPEHDSHNMNDLKALDFNSADDVRQAMRGIISGNIPQSSYEEVDCQTCKADKHSMLTSPIQTIEILKHTRSATSPIHKKDSASKVVSNQGKVNRKRPGRPPRAGPSKKVRKVTVTDMYLGKLSNVVPFKHKRERGRYDNGSETDFDTVYMY